jgi:hypothetical protein
VTLRGKSPKIMAGKIQKSQKGINKFNGPQLTPRKTTTKKSSNNQNIE